MFKRLLLLLLLFEIWNSNSHDLFFRNGSASLILVDSLLSDLITAEGGIGGEPVPKGSYFFRNGHNTINKSWTPELEGGRPDYASPDHVFKNPFVIPQEKVVPKWKYILGTFEHFDDDNWDNFLRKTGRFDLIFHSFKLKQDQLVCSANR